MKKFLLLTLSFILGFYFASFSQISQGGLPYSFTNQIPLTQIESKTIVAEHIEQIKEEDAIDEKMGVVFRYGLLLPVDANINNSGTWTELPDGRRVWHLMLNAPDALAIGVHFDAFKLPYGAELFIYSVDKQHVLGAYTHKNNHESLIFSTQLVKGSSVILEYIEPTFKSMGFLEKRNSTEKEKLNTSSLPLLNISHINYAYRNVDFLYLEQEQAEKSCMVGVNCSPEGNNWQDQKRGVARVSVVSNAGTGWCSGSLVNNIAQDCKPYFLLADHCGGTASSSQLNQWVFYFNYEATASNCQGTSGPTNQTMTGASLKARGPENGGSDFLLLELNQSVPASYNVHYAGWNRGTTGSPSGVSIHHPAGRTKKISTYTNSLTTTTWSTTQATGASGAHWRVVWAQTTNGHSVTAGGSSGSPIYDNNGRVVGTLTGGASYCHATSSPDMYGKFSYHWESNGSLNTQQLKPHLAPGSTITTLDGRNTCGSTPPGNLNCTNAINLTCGQTYNGTTVGQPSNVSTYNCATWNESGPERVHKITTSSTGSITATLSNLGSNDLDVFILSSCSQNACVAHGDNTATYASAPAGTYYIVVDGYDGASGTYTLNVTCSGGTTPSGCDTISNVGSSETLTFYNYTQQWGYASGHNGFQIPSYADKYNNTGTKFIKHAWVPVAKAHPGTTNSSVVFKAWNGAGALPSTVLGSRSFPINSFTVNQWKLIDFNPPIQVSGNFFFGFDISYGFPQDTFVVYIATHRPSGTNTAYAYYNNAWASYTTIFQGNLNSSLGLEPVVCTTADIQNPNLSGKVNIYPNPANDLIAVDLSSVHHKIINISVFNILGQAVGHIDEFSAYDKLYIDLEAYQTGLYFLKVETSGGNFVNKFTVTK